MGEYKMEDIIDYFNTLERAMFLLNIRDTYILFD